MKKNIEKFFSIRRRFTIGAASAVVVIVIVSWICYKENKAEYYLDSIDSHINEGLRLCIEDYAPTMDTLKSFEVMLFESLEECKGFTLASDLCENDVLIVVENGVLSVFKKKPFIESILLQKRQINNGFEKIRSIQLDFQSDFLVFGTNKSSAITKTQIDSIIQIFKNENYAGLYSNHYIREKSVSFRFYLNGNLKSYSVSTLPELNKSCEMQSFFDGLVCNLGSFFASNEITFIQILIPIPDWRELELYKHGLLN